MLCRRVQGLNSQLETIKQQQVIVAQELELERAAVSRDSLLFTRKAISEFEYETSHKVYLSKQSNAASFEVNLKTAALNLLQAEQEMIEVGLQNSIEKEEFESQIWQLVEQMDGSAEIITSKRRLIAVFLDPVISLFRNR